MLRRCIFSDQLILLFRLHFLSISNKGLALAKLFPRRRPTISSDVTVLAATKTGNSSISSPATSATTCVPTLPMGVLAFSRKRGSPTTRICDQTDSLRTLRVSKQIPQSNLNRRKRHIMIRGSQHHGLSVDRKIRILQQNTTQQTLMNHHTLELNWPRNFSHTHRILQRGLMTASAMNQFTNRRQKAFTTIYSKIPIQDLTYFLYAISPERQLNRYTHSDHLRRLTDASRSELLFGTAIEFVSYQDRAQNAHAL